MNKIFTLLALIGLLFVSCDSFEGIEGIDRPTSQDKVRVSIKSGSPNSRTSVAENGLTTTWSNEDQIAVWANNGTSNVLNAQPFKLY